MFFKLAGVALAVPVAAVAAVGATGVVVVDVREGGPSGHHIVVPMPLALARAGLVLAPPDKARIDVGEAAGHIPMARGVIEAIAAAPDGEFVRVEQPDEQVVLSKSGDLLKVEVHGKRGETVKVQVPLQAVLDILPRDGGPIQAAQLATALESLRFTDLVEVHDGDDQVKVWVF
jgi:type IV secretory pathway protease TraF